MTATIVRATGFAKLKDALVIRTAAGGARGGVGVHSVDFPRLLSIMCEGASREQLDDLHRVVAQRRDTGLVRKMAPVPT